jgi:hypothetical protein
MKSVLCSLGFDSRDPELPAIPIVIGSNPATSPVVKRLQEEGILADAGIIRFVVTKAHGDVAADSRRCAAVSAAENGAIERHSRDHKRKLEKWRAREHFC